MPDLLPTWNTASVTALREFAKIRLLALDVDGTLIQQSGQPIFLNIRNLANSSLLRPTHFLIATGRTLHGATPILRQWPAAMNSPTILYNGSVVANPRTSHIAYIRTIPLRSVATVLNLCSIRRRPVLAYVCRPEPLPIFDHQLEEVYGWSHDWRPEKEFNGLPVKWQVRWLYDHPTPPNALLVKASGPAAAELANLLAVVTGIDVTTSGSSFLEIRPRGSGKAIALSFVASRLGLSSDRVLAIGDNDNDADMLRWAGVGVAVAAASEEAVASANYMCHYGVGRGVVEILRLIRSARRYYKGEHEHQC